VARARSPFSYRPLAASAQTARMEGERAAHHGEHAIPSERGASGGPLWRRGSVSVGGGGFLFEIKNALGEKRGRGGGGGGGGGWKRGKGGGWNADRDPKAKLAEVGDALRQGLEAAAVSSPAPGEGAPRRVEASRPMDDPERGGGGSRKGRSRRRCSPQLRCELVRMLGSSRHSRAS